MLTNFRRALADEQGATAIEYALICAFIALVLIIVFDVGQGLVTALESLANALAAM